MRHHKFIKAAVLGLTIATTPSHALFGVGDVVFDPTAHVESVLTNARMAESLINEATQIKNQLDQYQDMLKQGQAIARGEWSQINGLLDQLADVMQEGDAMAYSMGDLDQLFKKTFPGYKPASDWGSEYETWTRQGLDTIRGVLNALGVHDAQTDYEQARLKAIQTLSDNAVGRMEVLQAANMLASEEVQSLAKLRQLMAMQINQQSLFYAREINSEAAKEATVNKWFQSPAPKAPKYGSGGVGPQDILNLGK